MKNNKYEFLNGTGLIYFIALSFGTIYNLLHIGTAYFMMTLVDAGNARNLDEIKKIVVQATFFLISFIVFGVIRSVAFKKYKKSVMLNYKRIYVDKILSMKFMNFKKNDNGRYLSNLTNNTQVISDGYVEGRINLFRASTRALLVIIIMICMNWKLFVITLICFVFPLLCGTVLNRNIVKTTGRVSDKNAQTVTSIKDLLAGFGVIKSFSAEKEVSKSFSKTFDELDIDIVQ